MTTGPHSISVIIPVFNGERYLGEAIESVLAQTLPSSEIIVVDDGSTDGTSKIARQFGDRVKYQVHPHSGVAAARNHGLAAAQCDWIAFLDADDVWVSNKLRLQADCLSARPRLQYVTAYAELFLEPGCQWPQNYKPELLDDKQFGLLSSFLGRKTVFEIVGGFDTQFFCADDMDWFARARSRLIPTALLESTLVRKRVHSSNITITSQVQLNNAELLLVIRRTLERKRKNLEANHA